MGVERRERRRSWTVLECGEVGGDRVAMTDSVRRRVMVRRLMASWRRGSMERRMWRVAWRRRNVRSRPAAGGWVLVWTVIKGVRE